MRERLHLKAESKQMETEEESRLIDVSGEVVHSTVVESVEECADGHGGTVVERSTAEEFESSLEVVVGARELGDHQAFAAEVHWLADEPRFRSVVGWCFVVCGSYHHSTSS